jgi:hypothetical protein
MKCIAVSCRLRPPSRACHDHFDCSITSSHEVFTTGGWALVLVSAEQRKRDRFGMERAAADGLVRVHGTQLAVQLVEFLDRSWGDGGSAWVELPRLSAPGFPGAAAPAAEGDAIGQRHLARPKRLPVA